MPGVFTAKASSAYDDVPEERYQFPSTYLAVARELVGDWIVYYEPRRRSTDLNSLGGRQAYFATARVDAIDSVAGTAGRYYARVSQYVDFICAVPFREGDHYYESGLRKADGTTNKGLFGRSVRVLPSAEFETIVAAGMAQALLPPHEGEPTYISEPFQRRIESSLVSRPVRDRIFASAVRAAYDSRCAMTGLRMLNGGGSCEMEAAHIQAVQHDGPDGVRNGVALSRTAHWMFDRGLVSIADDLTLLVATGRLPADAERLLLPDRRLAAPLEGRFRPHPKFLRFHREHCFKG